MEGSIEPSLRYTTFLCYPLGTSDTYLPNSEFSKDLRNFQKEGLEDYFFETLNIVSSFERILKTPRSTKGNLSEQIISQQSLKN